jgi:hypothetical protein
LLALVPRAALFVVAAGAITAAVVLLPRACSEDERQTRAATPTPGPGQVVREYARDLREGRYREACAYQTWSQGGDVLDECVRQLEAAGVDTGDFRLTVAAVRVVGLTAEVDVYGSAKATIALKKVGGRWLIASSQELGGGPES